MTCTLLGELKYLCVITLCLIAPIASNLSYAGVALDLRVGRPAVAYYTSYSLDVNY